MTDRAPLVVLLVGVGLLAVGGVGLLATEAAHGAFVGVTMAGAQLVVLAVVLVVAVEVARLVRRVLRRVLQG